MKKIKCRTYTTSLVEDIVEYIIGLSRKRYIGVYIGNNKAVLPETKIRFFIYHYDYKICRKIVLKIHSGRAVYTNLEFCRWILLRIPIPLTMDPDSRLDVRFCFCLVFIKNIRAKLYCIWPYQEQDVNCLRGYRNLHYLNVSLILKNYLYRDPNLFVRDSDYWHKRRHL